MLQSGIANAQARYRGSKGGKAKGLIRTRERNDIAPEWLIRNMVTELGSRRTAALFRKQDQRIVA